MDKPFSTIVSLPDVLLSPRPKVAVETALIKLLSKRLKELGIVWNASNFRKALESPKLPKWLLVKLENIIAAAEFSDWRISNSLKHELDETVEDIETFNPAYRAALKKEARDAERDFKAGKFISSEDLMAKYGIK